MNESSKRNLMLYAKCIVSMISGENEADRLDRLFKDPAEYLQKMTVASDQACDINHRYMCRMWLDLYLANKLAVLVPVTGVGQQVIARRNEQHDKYFSAVSCAYRSKYDGHVGKVSDVRSLSVDVDYSDGGFATWFRDELVA